MTRRVSSIFASKNRLTKGRLSQRATRARLPASLNPGAVSSLQAALMRQTCINLEADVALVLSSAIEDQYAGTHGFSFEGEIFIRIARSGGDVDAKASTYLEAVGRTDSFTDAECEASEAVKLAIAEVTSMAEVREVLQHALDQGCRPFDHGLTGLSVVGALVDTLASRLAGAGKASGEKLAAEIAQAETGFRTSEGYGVDIETLGELAMAFAGRLFSASPAAPF